MTAVRRALRFLVVVVSNPVWAQQGYIPDQQLTAGAINPHVTQQNVKTTACVSGWTTAVRPPSSYTSHLKLQQMRERGLGGTTRDYHEDHLVRSALAVLHGTNGTYGPSH